MKIIYFLLFVLQLSNITACRNYYKQNAEFVGLLFTQDIVHHYSNIANLPECVKYCRMHHCMSFSIHTESGLCRLYSTVFYSGSAAMTMDGVMYYYQWSDSCLGWKMTCSPMSTGVFNLMTKTEQRSFTVVCDMDTDEGGWTVIQNRFNGSVSFNNTATQYAYTFGSMDGEFWLGLTTVKFLCDDNPHEVRVDLEDWQGVRKFAKYSNFHVGWYSQQYMLTINGYYGTAGDSMGNLNGMKFSTFDFDMDMNTNINCAELGQGGWWYNACGESNINGRYIIDNENEDSTAITWWSFHRSYRPLKKTRMMMRAANSN